ncbi:PD-(D/E)XK nuclease family protein [Calidithermus roseus]|uniref:PD-(D/E)XK nuclease superfamily protein n=1 Tax=Calidithermus roseus TaxID=1644118 RepID=A0A399F103_9DEIN|nr:PD-(D/E)XK nuclease family protein [Calidithermus roseus]RIH88969.1 PD-(D/E)XK nuclease superfamily protein [Calidithermus roseus]
MILYPTLEADLTCPSRYVRARLRKEPTLAPFASTVLGKEVHERIASSLRQGVVVSQADDPLRDVTGGGGRPVHRKTFQLPRRVMLSEGEKLDSLLDRAQKGLARFEADYRPGLQGEAHRVEEFLAWNLELEGELVRFMGKLDLLLSQGEDQEVWDWKTGNPKNSREQLRLYLFLVYGATGNPPRLARAVGLESGEEVVEVWSEEVIPWGYAWLQRMRKSLSAALTNPRALNPGPVCRYCPYAHACPASAAPRRYLLDTRTGEVTEVAVESLASE